MLQNLSSTHFYNNVQLTLQQVMVHKKTRWQRWDRGVMRIWSLTPTTKILPAEISRAKNSPGPYAWKPGNQTAGFSSPFLYMDIYIYIYGILICWYTAYISEKLEKCRGSSGFWSESFYDIDILERILPGVIVFGATERWWRPCLVQCTSPKWNGVRAQGEAAPQTRSSRKTIPVFVGQI